MTGIPEFNYPEFHRLARLLRHQDWNVVSPVEACAHLDGTGAEWRDYLTADIAQLLTCKAIVLMDGWHHSRGARLEHHVALELGMEVLTVKEALA